MLALAVAIAAFVPDSRRSGAGGPDLLDNRLPDLGEVRELLLAQGVHQEASDGRDVPGRRSL